MYLLRRILQNKRKMKLKGSEIVRDISRNINVARNTISPKSLIDIHLNLQILEWALETTHVLIEKDFTKKINEEINEDD